nr:putative disease resistance RPP13-like protein 1 [Aegilops tauschii subsp. strangulata]XP_045088356.1 putative disease resistance RPP13-like protein 1 [Aegilops tauschii subsp. strangulata]
MRYVMHDLLHDLALKVASYDCLSLRLPSVGSMEIQPTTCHLSISTDDLGKYDEVSGEKLKSELEELKTRFKVEHLHTLMLFGKLDEGFVKIFGDFFGKVNVLHVLRLPSMLCSVESMLHNFSGLVHLRYLCLGTDESQMHLPLSISKFYHLRILDLRLWGGSHDLPENMSNLAKLCHFYVPYNGLHSDIYCVGKLKLLEELKVFEVNKKSEGFEPQQLEHLTKLRELGIYNLEKIDTVEEAGQAKLMEKKYLRKLTLEWDSGRTSVEPGVEAVVLERLQPHGDIQVLCIRGHGGPSCPTWLGDDFTVEALQFLYLDGVSWDVFPSLGKAWDLRELRLEDITGPKEFIIEESFCMLIKLELISLGSFRKWLYPAKEGSSLGGDLLPLDTHMFPLLQVLIIRDCSKLLGFPFSNHIVSPDWFPKLQELEVLYCPEFSSVIPISWIESLCSVTMKSVKQLEKFAYSKSSDGAELEIIGKGDLRSLDQVLVFDKDTGLGELTLEMCPPLELKHLLMLTSLKKLIVKSSDDLVGLLGGQGDVERQLPLWFPKLQKLEIWDCPEFSSVIPISWIERLRCVTIRCAKMLKEFTYSKSSNGAEVEIIGESDLHSIDQVLIFDKETCLEKLTLNRCPRLELKHLLMLTSLKTLFVFHSDALVGPLGGQGDVEWQLPIEHMRIWDLNGNSGEELTDLLPHLPKLSKLEIDECKT